MNLEENLQKLKQHATEIIAGIVGKDKITAAEMELAEKAVCTLNTINKIKKFELKDSATTSEHTHNKRDAMIDALYDMLASAQDDSERQYIKNWLHRFQ